MITHATIHCRKENHNHDVWERAYMRQTGGSDQMFKMGMFGQISIKLPRKKHH